jgi:hypothetical protein
MSAAPASVRPEATVTPLPTHRAPSPPTPAQVEARARSNERFRRFFTSAYFAAMALPPGAVAVGASTGDDWPVGVMILCYGLVTPTAGLVIFFFAVARRKPRETRALMAAVLALAASVASLSPAGAAGREAALDRNAAALEAIAGEVVRAGPEVALLVDGSWDRWAPGAEPAPEVLAAGERIRRRIRAVGFVAVSVGEGYVRFRSAAPFTPGLLYRAGPGAPDLREECGRSRLRFAGGAWYLLECLDVTEYQD